MNSPRALTARSVVLSVLLGTDPPRLPVQLLVQTTALFGIAEGTTRTALSRMREAGELTSDNGSYTLASERLLARHARQAVSREAATRSWPDQVWTQAVVVASGRRSAADRAALRGQLADARLAELREGVWLRPDNLNGHPELLAELADGLSWFRSVPEEDGVALAARLWNLPGWAERAERLLERMQQLIGPLREHDRGALAEGFVLSADVLRHFQADPLLPPQLRPRGWPGDRLRRSYDSYDAAYRDVLTEWFAEARAEGR